MATFRVDPVEKATTPLPSRAPEKELIARRTNGVEPESHSTSARGVPVASDVNSFVSAVHTAFSYHYPLVLSPDAVWMCIAQGFANHVNQNAEKLRHLFVEFESKKEIAVRRNDFVKGSPANAWPEAFEEFSQQIRKHVGDKTHDLITPEFSTTGPAERAAAQVVLMNTFKEYFGFMMMTDCGIPEITLEGTVADWRKLRDKALALSQYDLDWWITALKPVLDQFVSAAEGNVDTKFWSSIYKYVDESGGPYITGWIATLFPYIKSWRSELQPNHILANWNERKMFHGLTTDSFPPGVVATPFKWLYFYKEFPMHFYGGFMMVVQDPSTLALRPEIGWAVADEKDVETANKKAGTQRHDFF